MITTKIVHIVSIPERVESLKLTVESIIDQVDEMYVMLNSYTDIPLFLQGDEKISVVMLDNAKTDGAKAYNAELRNGYVMFLDDDLSVQPNYVDMMCKAVDKYKCLVSLHGKVFQRPITSFYRLDRNYRCLGTVLKDSFVDIVGSGVCCYHTDFLKVSYDDVLLPNMFDIWLSKLAHDQGIKLIVLAHKEGYLRHTPHKENIFQTENAKKFVRQTEILKSFLN